MKPFKVIRLGTVPYNTALDLQYRLLEKRINKEIDDTLILLEHPHTFTIGRRGNPDNLLVNENYLSKNNIDFIKISRGGDITYHGPGQLVGYPIFDMNIHSKDIHRYLRNLEEAIILCLFDFGIEARRIDKLTGVWVKRSKIASIGVGIKRWVTYHGFALNINTDLALFDMINPCGLQRVRMTSIKDWLGQQTDIDTELVMKNIVDAFSKVFEIDLGDEMDLRTEGEQKIETEINKFLS